MDFKREHSIETVAGWVTRRTFASFVELNEVEFDDWIGKYVLEQDADAVEFGVVTKDARGDSSFVLVSEVKVGDIKTEATEFFVTQVEKLLSSVEVVAVFTVQTSDEQFAETQRRWSMLSMSCETSRCDGCEACVL